MEEKKSVYQVFLDCWDVSKRYLFISLDDFLWERLVEELEEKSQKYKGINDNIWRLYRDIALAIQNYKERRDKKRDTEGEV